MANTINLTACDNQVVIIAFQWGVSYEICSISSGNSNSVNVNLNLVAGDYTNGVSLNGVNGPISGDYSVAIPSGTYNLSVVGINWGGPTQFQFSLNEQTYSFPFQQEGALGVVWTQPTLPVISVTV